MYSLLKSLTVFPSGVVLIRPEKTSDTKSRSGSESARTGFTKRGTPTIPSVIVPPKSGTVARKRLFNLDKRDKPVATATISSK